MKIVLQIFSINKHTFILTVKMLDKTVVGTSSGAVYSHMTVVQAMGMCNNTSSPYGSKMLLQPPPQLSHKHRRRALKAEEGKQDVLPSLSVSLLSSSLHLCVPPPVCSASHGLVDRNGKKKSGFRQAGGLAGGGGGWAPLLEGEPDLLLGPGDECRGGRHHLVGHGL